MTALSRTSSVSSKNGKPVIMATNNSSTGGTSKQNGGKMPPRALSRSNSDRQKKGKKYIIWTPCLILVLAVQQNKMAGKCHHVLCQDQILKDKRKVRNTLFGHPV